MKVVMALATAAIILETAGASATQARSVPLIEEIPVHPAAAPAPRDDSLSAPQLGFTLETERLYIVKASPEAVVKFYQSRLSAREVTEEQFDAAIDQAEAGALRGALFTFESHDLKSPALRGIKDAIQKRPPHRPGQWIAWARFVWSRRQSNDEVAQFGIGIVDGLDMRRTEPQTVLLLAAGVPGGDADDTGEAEDEAATQQEHVAPQASAPEPSAAELGVPRYPGAVFDGLNSAGMSSDEERYFIYTTGDPQDKVVAFYERQTGKKALKTEGGAMIPVEGTGLFPELGVTIQPNTGSYPRAVRTIVTVRNGRGQ
ncbi:MAG TPA: hypothetical protein VFN94_04165 [Nitrospiria bacterium]|nr:hypothetical protein [Nitrospiria bacterium]